MNHQQASYEGTVTWQSPSNIALVKYWGKHGNQLPINPSVSLTLREAITTTTIQYNTGNKELQLEFFFEGKKEPAFAERIRKYLLNQSNKYDQLKRLQLSISSSNTFPHSSGIASSASAFSALALGVLSIVSGNRKDANDRNFYREASTLARLGSGSACRSVYPGYVVWGKMNGFPAYTDQYAVAMQTELHELFSNMQDAILIVSEGKKKVGSSAGHKLMDGHPYRKARISQAHQHMTDLHRVLPAGDMERFIEIVENEALSLHGLMLASNPGYLLMEANTFRIIEEIRAYRKESNVPLCFTLDAGPNVHLLYPEEFREQVKKFIGHKLTRFCINDRWLDDGMGPGPKQISEV